MASFVQKSRNSPTKVFPSSGGRMSPAWNARYSYGVQPDTLGNVEAEVAKRSDVYLLVRTCFRGGHVPEPQVVVYPAQVQCNGNSA